MNKEQALAKINADYDVIGVIDTSQWHCLFVEQTWTHANEQLAELYSDSYQPTQRIVIVVDRSKFNNTISFQNFLQKWQQLINKNDITNCFIVFLHNAVDDKKLIQSCQDISSDSTQPTFIGYQDNVNVIDQPKSLSLTESSTFCILPWIHLMIQPYNGIKPCCMALEDVGNLKSNTLQDAWNSEEMKRVRTSMLNNAYHPSCSRCYENELHGTKSARLRVNNEYSKHFDLVEQTAPDGSLEKFNLKFLDIRFSNICNLRCRTCDHHSSSRWYHDQKKLDPGYDNPIIIKAGRHSTDVWEQIQPHLDSVEKIYFAGGEPLIMDEHYWILEALEQRQRLDVKLVYNTNFTVIHKAKWHVFDYWAKFKDVSVGASLDAMGTRGEYLRKDTVWDDVVKNKILLSNTAPHVKFKISLTISIFNVLHAPDFHREWVNQGLIGIDEIALNYVFEPKYYKVDVAPAAMKEKIQLKYLDHIKWLENTGASEITINEFKKCLSFVNGQDNSYLLDQLRKHTKELDNIRNENVIDIFPELNDIF